MDIDVFATHEQELTPEQTQKFLKYVFCDDLEIYEKEIMQLPIEQQVIYFNDNPEFMADYAISRTRKSIELLKNDETFRKVLRGIKKNQSTEKKTKMRK